MVYEIHLVLVLDGPDFKPSCQKPHTLYGTPQSLPIADQSITDKVLINWLSVALITMIVMANTGFDQSFSDLRLW